MSNKNKTELQIENTNNSPNIAKRKKKVNNNDTLFVELEDNSFVDINAEFKWDCLTLTENQKRFIFYYAYPFSNNARGKGAECARKSGYAEKTARITSTQLLQNPIIYNELKNIQSQISDNLTKTNIKNKVNEILQQKLKRTQINVNDYYTLEKTTNEDGVEYVKGMIKPTDELTDEQKEMIEDIEFVGQRGILHYKLPNKRESENEIIKIYKELYGDKEEQKEDYDIETTVDVIKDSLKVKTKLIRKNSEITELSDLKNNAENNRAEED